MKNAMYSMLICFLLLPVFLLAQDNKKIDPSKDPQNMEVLTSQEPFYPKGDAALFQYVLHAVKYSDEAIQKYVEGTVTLSFDVAADSTVGNVSVVSGVCCGINEEVMRVVKELKFAPAIQNGVKMRMNLMMDFPVKAHK